MVASHIQPRSDSACAALGYDGSRRAQLMVRASLPSVLGNLETEVDLPSMSSLYIFANFFEIKCAFQIFGRDSDLMELRLDLSAGSRDIAQVVARHASEKADSPLRDKRQTLNG